MYPISLDLNGRAAVVVGGGPVAARRALGLIDAGAVVTVVSPWAVEEIRDAADLGRLHWIAAEFHSDHLAGAWLVQTATGEPAVDTAVAAAAEQRRIWAVRCDDAAASAAWVPAVHRSGPVTVAVTAGGDPGRSAALRNAIALALDAGDLPDRPRRSGTGRVTLIGGGPGADDLITVRGRRALAEADVVIVDRLAPQRLLERLDATVEVIDAGKAPHAHTLTQDQINELLVERAGRGQRVVRLKGGDPFVLGRGSEEAAACAAAGIPVEVIPGITSAIAVPAAAGIPVTHRGAARGFSVLTAHDADLDLSGYPDDHTLVLLMGVSRLAPTVDDLLAAGRDPRTPVAIIERGTTPEQRVTTAPLDRIVALAAEREVTSPAVIVVGDVVDQAGRW